MSTPAPRRQSSDVSTPSNPQKGNHNNGPPPPPSDNESFEGHHPPPMYHPGPPHHEHPYHLMPGEYPFPMHPMMGMHPDHYGMPPMLPPMHPSDMNDHHHPPHHHHHHHHMMSEFPQPPPPARFMPPRPRVLRQPPRVPNRIIVQSNNFDPRRNEIDDMPKRKERAPSSSSFPTKLYKILADPQYREYIAWLPHGRAWRVLKPKAFEEDVIPKFFRSERYASFMRQVNGWGFKRITEGPDLNSYYHEMFLRGLPQICAKMRRPQKGQGASQNKDSLGQAPDLYKISLYAPLPPLEHEEALPLDQPKTPEPKEPIKTMPSPDINKSNGSLSNKEPNKISSTGSNDEDEADVSKVTPTRPETKAPQTPKRASPAYAPLNHSPQYGATLSPTDMGREFVELPNSAGNSVTSWTNSPSEEDLMFGSLPNAFSPHHDHQHQYYNHHHNRGRHPSPLPNFPSTDGGGGGGGRVPRPLIPPRGFDVRTSPPPPMDHHDGLSEADLSYLTFQNRILLSQANRGSNHKKPKSS